jgi:thioredoxin 1
LLKTGAAGKLGAMHEPTRAEVDAFTGPTVLEFGTSWCGYCRAAQPAIAAAMHERPAVRHIRIEDGRGRPLGRSFRVKLWPTLVFLRDGRVLRQAVRPSPDEVEEGFAELVTSTGEAG